VSIHLKVILILICMYLYVNMYSYKRKKNEKHGRYEDTRSLFGPSSFVKLDISGKRCSGQLIGPAGFVLFGLRHTDPESLQPLLIGPASFCSDYTAQRAPYQAVRPY